jgi:hypothetical protein
MRLAAEMIAAGATDQAIADRIGGIHRMAVSRHRRLHVVAPAKALADAAGKGRDAIEERAQVLAAAEAGDPSAFVTLAAIVTDLRTVQERLNRVADGAERDNQRLAVSALSGQQLRAAEVRAKIGAVGGYAPPRVQGGGIGQTFVLNIQFRGAGRTETIGGVVTAGDGDGHLIDARDGPAEIVEASAAGALPDAPPTIDDLVRLFVTGTKRKA